MITFNFNFRHMIGLNIILASVALVALFCCAWQWHSDWQLAHQQISPRVAVAHQEDNSLTMIAALPNTHLFGKPISAGAVPLSSLQFKLSGIVKSDRNSESKVYLSLAGGQSKIFHVGDNLPYGVKVYDITPDAVILENDGHLEKLTFSRERLQFKARNSLEQRADA